MILGIAVILASFLVEEAPITVRDLQKSEYLNHEVVVKATVFYGIHGTFLDGASKCASIALTGRTEPPPNNSRTATAIIEGKLTRSNRHLPQWPPGPHLELDVKRMTFLKQAGR
jgi:hypothetical protein